jgi:beta-glucosidase/6-phospho-beta-glucosidase/beta-galactosidase
MEEDGLLWGVASSAHQVEEVAPNEWFDSSDRIVSKES